ncbi:MAG: DegV family protein [Oscillospiraceae bacterium]|nr:DegV family protein [Oscillospiraceae bacterium]
MSIKVITDSASDITQKEAVELGISVVPMTVSFGGTEYVDGVTLNHRQFFEKLVETDVLPTTSQVSPASFEDAFSEASRDGSEIICITLSSKLSGTYQSACIAAEEYPNVTVIDSENVSAGIRILALRALEFIKKGMSVAEIKDILLKERKQVKVIALLDTLEYLKKGGRISAATAFAGGILSIKPVIEISEGEVKIIGKARGSKAGNNRLNEKVEESGGIDFSCPICLAYSGLDDSMLRKYIEDSKALYSGKMDKEELPVATIGSVVGTHAGPGVVGIAFFALG